MMNKRLLSTAMLTLLLASAGACAQEADTVSDVTTASLSETVTETEEVFEDSLFPKLNYAFPEADGYSCPPRSHGFCKIPAFPQSEVG